MNLVSSHSTLRELYPQIIVKFPGTTYPRVQTKIKLKHIASIDELGEGEEKVFLERE